MGSAAPWLHPEHLLRVASRHPGLWFRRLGVPAECKFSGTSIWVFATGCGFAALVSTATTSASLSACTSSPRAGAGTCA